MENLLILGAVVLSGLLCYKQDLFQTWIFFVNLSFSVYIALFIAPVIAGLIPEFSSEVDSCKLPASMLFLTLFLIFGLYKLTDTACLKSHDQYPLPDLAGKLCAMFFGGLSGAVMLSFLCTCLFMMPFSENISDKNRETYAGASRTIVKLTVKTLNFFSMQSMSRAEEEVLKNISAYKPPK